MKIRWKKSRIIFEIGQKSDCAYILISGEVQLKSKDNIEIGIIGEDEIFGEQSCLLGTNRSVTAIATKDSEVFKVSKEILLEQYKKTPVIIKSILRTNYIRLKEQNLNRSLDIKKSLEELTKLT